MKEKIAVSVLLIVMLLAVGCSSEEISDQNGTTASIVVDELEVNPKIIETTGSANLTVKLANEKNNYTYQWKLGNDEAGSIEATGKQAIYKAGSKPGKYKIKVIVSNDVGKKIYAEEVVEVKENINNQYSSEVETQATGNKLGIWLWYLPDTKYNSHHSLASDLGKTGIKRIYVKVNDEGADHYFKPCLDNGVVNAYKNQDLEVWAWGYNYPHSISNQAQAVYNAAKVGYEGYVLDVEKDFESSPNSLVELARAVYNAKQRAINNGYAEQDFKIYLSSFGNIMSHRYIKISAVDQYVDGYMPQTYLEVWGQKYMQNPEKYVRLDKEEYRQAGATKAIHNVISVEYGKIKSSQINRAFKTAGNEASIWRVPRWNGGDPEPNQQWQIIRNVNWNMYQDGSETHQINLKATAIKPDDNYSVETVMSNQSNVDIDNFAISLWINDKHYRKEGLNIKAGENKSINIETNITIPSAYNATLLVDSLAQVDETDENDNKINQTISFGNNNLPPVPGKKVTINHPDKIIKEEIVKFSGVVPQESKKVIISVDGWVLTNGQGQKKIAAENGQYQLNYSFHQAKHNRELLVRAFDNNGQLLAQKKKKINVYPNDEKATGSLTINYPEQIIAGNQIQFRGQVPFSTEKVIISVDGWPLTDENGNKHIKAVDSHYSLNYKFDTAKTDRNLVIKAFDKNGKTLGEKKEKIDVLANDLLTVEIPTKVKSNEQFIITGQALSPIYKVVISVDGHQLGEQKVSNGKYRYDTKLNQIGRNRRLVVNAFDKNGNSVKQLRRSITVTGDYSDPGRNLGAEFANYVNDNWSSLKDEAMDNISAGTDCVAFVSAALRDFDYNIYATVTDGITGNQTKEDTLVYNLFAAGFKKSKDLSQLRPGDICFTKPQYYPGVELSNPYTPDQREGYFPNHSFIFMGWVNSSSTRYAWVVDNQGRRHKRNMSVAGNYTPFGYFMYLPEENNDNNPDDDFEDSNLTLDLDNEIKVNETIQISGRATGKIHKVIVSVDKWKIDEIVVDDNRYNLAYTFNQAGHNRTLAVKAFDRNGYAVKEVSQKINVVGDNNNGIIQGVPYYYQYYNSVNPDGSCQNSAVAAVLNYYNWGGDPDTISSSSFGTGTAQTPEGLEKVFNYYARNNGLDVRVDSHRYGRMSNLNALLADGKPVIVHGYFTGYGHVITLVGYDGTYYYANDSAGKWDQTYKGDYYRNSSVGKYVKYHKSNMKNAVYSSDGQLWYHEVYFK